MLNIDLVPDYGGWGLGSYLLSTEGKVKKVELGEQPLDLVVQTQRQPEEHNRTKNGKLKMVGTNSSSKGGLTGHEGAPDSREGSESSRELRGNKGSNMGGHKSPVRSSPTKRKYRIERSRMEELTRGADNGSQDDNRPKVKERATMARARDYREYRDSLRGNETRLRKLDC
ncbi:hypothetical protein SAY86_004484 [Trapa natans]|uniref:Uncharacterized protein n=1 Tax=Trapa natans TaxID=22666 RepID=A0AAN7MVC0_TRANT|nr:hypothetical protein SAY86_004484 [Trapa natans]